MTSEPNMVDTLQDQAIRLHYLCCLMVWMGRERPNHTADGKSVADAMSAILSSPISKLYLPAIIEDLDRVIHPPAR